MTVIIGDDQRWGREPVSHEILRRAQVPVVIVIVDTVARLSEFVPHVQEILAEGLILLEDVEQVCAPSHGGRKNTKRGGAA